MHVSHLQANNGWTTMGNPVKTVEYEDVSCYLYRVLQVGCQMQNAYVREETVLEIA